MPYRRNAYQASQFAGYNSSRALVGGGIPYGAVLTEEPRVCADVISAGNAECPRREGLPSSAHADASTSEKPKADWANILLNALLVLAAVALLASFAFGQEGAPRVVAGYSASTVLTGSMQNVYPQGSLIITKSVDPTTLQVGDDITYMATEDSTITHRIVEIVPDGAGTLNGELAFITKGTNNNSPDPDPVIASNVVGKVVFSSYAAGQATLFLKTYWPILVFLAAIAFATKAVLKRINKNEETDEGREGERDACMPVHNPVEAELFTGARVVPAPQTRWQVPTSSMPGEIMQSDAYRRYPTDVQRPAS